MPSNFEPMNPCTHAIRPGRRMRFLPVVFFLTLFAPCLPAAAQDAGPIELAGFGGLTLGVRYLNVTSVNHYLESAGATLPSDMPLLGVHAAALLGERFVIDGRGDTAFFLARGARLDAKYYCAGGSAEFGYAAVNNVYGLAYPFVGAGGYQSVLSLPAGNRLDLVKWYNGNNTARQTSAVVAVGFAYHYPVRLAVGETEDRLAMFLGGIAAGATFNVGDRRWRDAGGHEIAGLGAQPLNTFFLNVDVSFGGGVARAR